MGIAIVGENKLAYFLAPRALTMGHDAVASGLPAVRGAFKRSEHMRLQSFSASSASSSEP
jgi:hypothetical protein